MAACMKSLTERAMAVVKWAPGMRVLPSDPYVSSAGWRILEALSEPNATHTRITFISELSSSITLFWRDGWFSFYDGALHPYPSSKFGPNPKIDLDDPATRGCLLHQARHHHKDPKIHVEPIKDEWEVVGAWAPSEYGGKAAPCWSGDSEIECLIKCLEAPGAAGRSAK